MPSPDPSPKLLSDILTAMRQQGVVASDNSPVSPFDESIAIHGVSCDSRNVKPADAFFCLLGQHNNGNDFVEQAIKKGASCIFSEDGRLKCSVPLVVVTDARLALSGAADYLYDSPSSRLRLLGVTGTNGKTTTVHLVEHIVNTSGAKPGMIGTLGFRWQGKDGQIVTDDCGHTTPQAPELQKTLWSMADAGVTHVAMEVSSQALALKRVVGCQFASACLTNITQDHLDFHKSMEQYWQAKLQLFDLLSVSKAAGKHAIVNLDEPLAKQFLKVLSSDVAVQTYSAKQEADIAVKSVDYDFYGSRLELKTPEGLIKLNLHLNGPFNVYNVMAAMAICLGEGIPISVCKTALESYVGVPGRFQIVGSGEIDRRDAPLCIVDYAHTPDSLKNILQAARVLVPLKGKLIVVFGCGGDRDTSKRPQMGEIAERLADKVVVTSDNPRSEEPRKIISEILAGISRLSAVVVEPDRAESIRLAVKAATNQDVIVVAGKGHENYQIIGDKTIPFDDRDQVQSALKQRALSPS